MAARRMILLLSPLPLLTILLTLTACGVAQPRLAEDTLELTIADRPFTLELALDSETRTQGLSDRQSIPADGGMLFVFPNSEVRQFVMRRCLVPIDIVFLGPSGRVVAMHEMAIEPYHTPEEDLRRYSSQWPGQFAIEFKDGTIDALGLTVGQVIDLPLAELKRRAE